MSRNELYIEIIKSVISVHAHYVSNLEDVQLEIEVNGVYSALTILHDGLSNAKIKEFVKIVIDVHPELDDDLGPLNDFATYVDEYQNTMQKREFMLFENNIIVINSNKLFEFTNNDKEKKLKAIEYLCFKEQDRRDFLLRLTADEGSSNDYYLIYKLSDFTYIKDAWQLYSYALFKYTCNNKVEINSSLIYNTADHTISIPPMFNKDVMYEQYYDIYDVLSEWHHSTDILTAFLRMYQILEYIIYRKRLVSIITGANIKQSFVRQVIGIDKQYSKSEREIVVNELKRMIDFSAISTHDINNDIKSFCTKYFYPNGRDNYLSAIDYGNPNSINVAISKFIYDTRCSIVHNKESEFHMSYANYEEYKSLIPLMNKTMIIIRQNIVNTLNNTYCDISFTSKHLPLY